MKLLSSIAYAILSNAFSFAADAAVPAPIVLGKARFSVLAAECIRMEWSESSGFVDRPTLFATKRSLDFSDYVLKPEGQGWILETPRMRLSYRPDGQAFHAGNLSAVIKHASGKTTAWKPGAPSSRNLGGTLSSLDGVFGPRDLGEGLLSRDGWYLIDDSLSPVLTKDWVEPRSAGKDWYLFAYGNDYKAAFKALTGVAERVPLPRKYALGSWYSRYWPHSAEDFRRIVKEYESNGFPLDVLVLDMDWHREGWTGWSWNRELIADPKAFLSSLHASGLAVTLNVHPADGVAPHEDAYASFMQAMGADPASRLTLPFDAGNQRYLGALFERVHQPLENEGVDFWWLDWQQTPHTPSLPSLTNLAWLNREYYRHSTRDRKRGLSFSRWGGWGDHKHPIHFSGDASTDWAMLEFEVPFTTTSANVGCFYWSHDIGGHVGARDEEAFVRWVQFGSTSAALRLHSTRSPELDRRPWIYSPAANRAMKEAFHLRSRLFPYLYSTAWQAYDKSIPLLRAMYLEHPEDEQSYRSPQQYYLGDAFIAAPITTPGQGSGRLAFQKVWLPEGRWFHWHTGEELQGSKTHLAPSLLDEFPLFAKGGVPIALQPFTLRMSRAPLEELVIHAYPGPRGSLSRAELYEDDGISQGYLRSEYTLTDLSYSRRGNEVVVAVSPPRGGFQGQLTHRSYVIELPATRRATKVRADYGSVKLSYDPRTLTNTVRIPKRDILRGLRLAVWVEDAPESTLRAVAVRRRQSTLGPSKPAQLASTLSSLKAADPIKETHLALHGVAARLSTESPSLHPLAEQSLELDLGTGAWRATSAKARVVDRIGDRDSVVTELSCTAKAGARCARKLLARLSPPSSEDVLAASRRLEVSYVVKGKNLAVERTLEKLEPVLRAWRIAGPFAYSPDISIEKQVHPPESGSPEVKWEPRAAAREGILSPPPAPSAGVLGYAVTYLRSDRDQQATLTIGSDDGVEAWVDGRKFHSHNIFRPINDKPDTVKLDLAKGDHTLLFKISHKGPAWSLRVGVSSEVPLKHRDTPWEGD